VFHKLGIRFAALQVGAAARLKVVRRPYRFEKIFFALFENQQSLEAVLVGCALQVVTDDGVGVRATGQSLVGNTQVFGGNGRAHFARSG